MNRTRFLVSIAALLRLCAATPARAADPVLTQGVDVTFIINSTPSYQQTIHLSDGLPVGVDTIISFPSWTATRGAYAARCSTWEAGDQVWSNNVLFGWFAVGTVDVGAVAIVSPVDTVDTSTAVTPSARVVNNGDFPASFAAFFRIDSVGGTTYQNFTGISRLSPGTESLVTFPVWPKPHRAGQYTTRCSTYLVGDGNPANDIATDSLTVTSPGGGIPGKEPPRDTVYDVGVSVILSPLGTIDSGGTVAVACSVHNYASGTANFDVVADISDGFHGNVHVTNLTGGTSRYVYFANWHPILRGAFLIRCSTRLAGDVNPENDRQTATVYVAVNDIGAVAIVAPSGYVPPGPIVPQAIVHNYGTERYTAIAERSVTNDLRWAAIAQAVPEPFRQQLRIEYQLTQDCRVELGIYNTAGLLVRTLRNGLERAGTHSLTWAGVDARGRPVPPGVYFCRLLAGAQPSVLKITRLVGPGG